MKNKGTGVMKCSPSRLPKVPKVPKVPRVQNGANVVRVPKVPKVPPESAESAPPTFGDAYPRAAGNPATMAEEILYR